MDRRVFLGGLLAGATIAAPGFAQSPSDEDLPFALKVAMGAEAQHGVTTIYDPAYVKLAFPMGDVPIERGVCTDVVIRAFRHAGVDLQAEVNADMKAAFSAYPEIWGLSRPDRNIDHRRVPNLETYFTRKGASKRLSKDAADYQPGDVVSWRLTGSGLPHTGVVTRKTRGGQKLVAHNIGAGVQLEPCLFDWPMNGWFRVEAQA
jgi:uncharacterized protein YijF (DUF1287 family)